MSDAPLEIVGSYQYASSVALDGAIVAARERIASGGEAHWMDFIRDGATLHIHARVPAAIDRLFAVSILHALASTATHGAVETRRGGRPLEYYFVENDA
jgi:hypothetical protein